MGMAVIAMEDTDVVVSEEGRTTIWTCISGRWVRKVVDERDPPGTAVCVRGFDWELPVLTLILQVSASFNGLDAASVSSADGYTRRKPAALIRT